MTYLDSYEHKIGFTSVRNEILRLCTSDPGRKAAEEMLTFSADFATVERRLKETAEMLALISGESDFAIGTITDADRLLAQIKAEGTFLSPEELLQLCQTLQTAASVAAFFRLKRTGEGDDDGADRLGHTPFPLLNVYALQLDEFPQLTRLIDASITRFGEVKDSASAELSQIRRQLSSTMASLSTVMRRVVSRAVEAGYLEGDTSPVVRDGRLVLPVSPMNKRKIPGIVHDESASGKTYFIEPSELVEANNRIRELQIEEKREITRILRLIADEIRPEADVIRGTVATLGIFDFIHAKARYAVMVDGRMPVLERNPEIEWYHAVHPALLLSLRRQGKQIVPLDIRLTPAERLLIISGPNAGGKSVCLKTVGIVQYMAQCGVLPTVYENSHTGIFDNIFIDIGDDQSIEDDLSTYSSHLRNMNYFLANGDEATLLLIDEFGGGTEPLIGGAIAQAILRQFNDRKMWGVITTHYQNLKSFAQDTPGLVNGSMLYDRQHMQPLFKLVIGNPGSSFAIEIARKTGLPASIIADAEEIAGSDYVKLDRYLLDIARDRRYWERKRDDIRIKEKKIEAALELYENDAETLRTKRREIIEDARTEARRILEGSNAAIERTIREIRESQAEKEQTRAARQRLLESRRELSREDATDNAASHPLLKERRRREKKPQPQPKAAPAELKPGDNVKLDGGTTVGTIMEISGKEAVVNFGMLKTTVALSRLKATIAKPQTGAKAASFVSTQTTAASRDRQLAFKREIDLRGMRVDEALQAVTYYIDDASQFNAGEVRLLHGTGTGALRQSIRQYLDTRPEVASYRDEHVQFGGAGITVVTLK